MARGRAKEQVEPPGAIPEAPEYGQEEVVDYDDYAENPVEHQENELYDEFESNAKNCCVASVGVVTSNVLCYSLFILIISSVFIYGAVVGKYHMAGLFMMGLLPPVILLYVMVFYWRKRGLSLQHINTMFVVGFSGGIPIALVETGCTLAFNSLFGKPDKNNTEDTALRLGYAFVNAFIFAALIEEMFKYLCARSQKKNVIGLSHEEPARYMIMASLSSALGFAALENMMMIGFTEDPLVGTAIAIARALVSIPLHACCGVLIGLGITRHHIVGEHLSIFSIVGPSALIHGLYDFFLMTGEALQPMAPWAPVAGFAISAMLTFVVIWYTVYYSNLVLLGKYKGNPFLQFVRRKSNALKNLAPINATNSKSNKYYNTFDQEPNGDEWYDAKAGNGPAL